MTAKRLRANSKFSLRKCEKSVSKDRISELPDEVLISVLSRLNGLYGAAKTSVLSHRWEKLWTSVPMLNFDACGEMEYIHDNRGLGLENGRLHYVEWVNQVLQSYSSSSTSSSSSSSSSKTTTIEDFRICFDLTAASAHDIDSWISFAIKRRVQRLEIDLSVAVDTHFGQWYKIPREPFDLSCCKSLKYFCMVEVDVSDDVFEHILSNSPCLERLYVQQSFSLMNVKIFPPSSLNLKHFEIYQCMQLQSIEISATKLVLFKYCGRKRINLVLKNVPQLVDVSFGRGLGGHRVIDISRQLSSYLPQIKKLEFSMNDEVSLNPTRPQEVAKWPILSNLRHLELVVFVEGGMTIQPIISLLEASPFIHTFKMKLSWFYTCSSRSLPERKTPKITKIHPYPFLKVVELLDFVGDTEDTEIAMYLLENAKSLNKLIVRPSHLEFSSIESEFLEVEKQSTRESAIQLGKKLPLGAEFLMQ